MSQRDDFVNVALAQIGKLYYDTRDQSRCDWSEGFTDCSGLVVGAANRVGYFLSCINSSGLARLCHDAARPQWMTDRYGRDPWSTQGTGLTAEQARTTKGALKFHGYDEGIHGDGPTGHVGISLGDGRSVEAASHALDLGIFEFVDNRDTYYALLPGMTGFEPEEKVHPMYSPPMPIAADLKNPQGGRWEARPDGTVRLVTRSGDIVEGGMVSSADRKAFAGRQVAQLHLRWYKPKGALRRKAGFTIEATSGEKYVPSAQH